MQDRRPEIPFEHLLRELAPQVLGVVARRFRDFSSAEDAVQEALIAAFRQWPGEGIPENPRGWLIRVASRRMTDILRSEIARRERESSIAEEEPAIEPVEEIEAEMDPEDTLILLFMCCHPALSASSAIALTLRAVGGLTTAEIAHAFLVPEATMAQRISRAKQSIRASRVPFRAPTPQERSERLPAVLRVLYLIFSEGYASSIGSQLQRLDLAREAIRLTRGARALLPEDAEVAGLLALMLLTDARRSARTGPDGEIITLDQQDRRLWDRDEIGEGTALLTLALSKGAVGLYQLQAAIAAVHDEAAQAEDTDWPQILALYELLQRVAPGPMVTLNHAIAVAMVHGPASGLERLQALDRDERLSGHYRLDAVRAHLFEMLGDQGKAIRHYRAAAAGTSSLPEQNYLIAQAARLEQSHRDTSAKPADSESVS
ncbi:MAG TPA: sigma-70 family RNA polymerase sigma factor [Acidobacteriaceae bacterium]|nr:sigma-70 family RNA polymerase sigma factor [Acidobacteriaceae bacterium]